MPSQVVSWTILNTSQQAGAVFAVEYQIFCNNLRHPTCVGLVPSSAARTVERGDPGSSSFVHWDSYKSSDACCCCQLLSSTPRLSTVYRCLVAGLLATINSKLSLRPSSCLTSRWHLPVQVVYIHWPSFSLVEHSESAQLALFLQWLKPTSHSTGRCNCGSP